MELREVYEQHHASLVRYLSRYCGNSDLAEDAAQEAFLRLSQRPPSDTSKMRGWLFRVATNIVLDRWRSDKHHRDLLETRAEQPGIGDSVAVPDEIVERLETQDMVRRALDQLSDRDRTVLLMREEGFSHREIADAVGTNTGSVGTIVARALRKLSKALALDVEAE